MSNILEKSVALIFFGIYLGVASSLSIAALVVSNKDGDNTCIGHYNGISITYAKYLVVFGWTTISISLFTLFTVLISLVYKENILQPIAIALVMLFSIFDFCWYIVGTILFFKEVNNNCGDYTMIHQFGLALFIIKTIAWSVACCGSRHNSNNTN